MIEKQFEKSLALAQEVMKKADNDLNKVKEIDPKVQVGTTGRFNTTTAIPTVGKDNAFIYTSLQMKVGETSEPVKGLKGYYVIHLNEKTPFDSTAFQNQLPTLRNNVFQEKKNAALSNWVTQIKEQADIVDNRYMFYGY